MESLCAGARSARAGCGELQLPTAAVSILSARKVDFFVFQRVLRYPTTDAFFVYVKIHLDQYCGQHLHPFYHKIKTLATYSGQNGVN